MGSKTRKEGWCQMTEVENWCPVLWEVESLKVSGQVNEMMPFKAYLWHYIGTGDIVGTRKTVLKPLH